MKELDNIYLRDLVYILNEDTTLKRYYALIPIREKLIAALTRHNIWDKYDYLSYSPEQLADIIRIKKDYLVLLNIFLHLHDYKNRRLSEIEGVDPALMQALANAGIRKTMDYINLYKGSSADEIARAYAAEKTQVEKLFSLCDLMRLPGVKSIRANLYFNCGYQSIKDFVGVDACWLRNQISHVIALNGWVEHPPLLKELKTQIAVATILPVLV